MHISPFYIDAYPVTVADYWSYLNQSGYQPQDSYGWLMSWLDTTPRTPPPELLRTPVVHVSLQEARDFCQYYHKRLPQDYEWQYAAQNGNSLKPYPWGFSSPAEGTQIPTLKSGAAMPVPDPVDAHPEGATPTGIHDLVGNVWQYTSEFHDAHNRAVILRGSSCYQAKTAAGTNWYFQNLREVHTHNKYYLMDPTFERAATIGFRCVADAT